MNVQAVNHRLTAVVLLLAAMAAALGLLMPAPAAAPATAAPARPDAPGQDACGHGGTITELAREGFEDPSFPPSGGPWSVRDVGADPAEVTWGRVVCEAASGLASLWSVGGGRLGSQLSCDGADKGYPSGPRGIRSLLSYGPIDLSGADSAGLRVTFDYLARAPQDALLVGIADLAAQAPGAPVNYIGFTYFAADTGGEWVRDHTVNCDGGEFDAILAGFDRLDQVGLAFFYRDPARPGSAGPADDAQGVFIDNVRIGAKSQAPPTAATPTAPVTVRPPGPTATPGSGTAPPIADEPAQRQVFAPLLRRSDTEDTRSRLSVQSLGTEPSKVILVLFGAAGDDCAAPSAAPLKVECSGLLGLQPGVSWHFGEAQLPEGRESAVAFSISARSFDELGIGRGQPGSDERVADFLCERLWFDLPGDAAAYARFKQAFDQGGDYDGLPMDRVLGAPISATVLRDHQQSPEPRLDQQQAYSAPRGDELEPVTRTADRWQYRLPLRTPAGPQALGVWLQNGGASCASPRVEVQLPRAPEFGCSLPPVSCAIAAGELAPGQSRLLDLTSCAALSGQAFVLQIESAQPLAIAIEETAGRQGSTGLSGNLEAGTRLQAPLAMPDRIPIQHVEVLVQNHDPSRPAQILLHHQASNGTVRDTDQAEICPGGLARFELTHSHDPRGSLRIESRPQPLPDGSAIPGPPISAQVRMTHDPDGTWPGQLRYGMQASDVEDSRWVERGLLAAPVLTKGDGESEGVSQLMILNATDAPGFTELIFLLYDQNGLLDFTCERLDQGQVAPIDLRLWGSLSSGFRGSALVSAVYWQHLAYDGQGQLVANPVELVATWAERGINFESRSEQLVRPRALRLDAFDADFAARHLPRLHDGLTLTCPNVPDPLPTRIPRPATPTALPPASPTPTGPTTMPSPSPGPGTVSPTPTPSATAARPAPLYLPALLSSAEPWPTGFILLVDTSPDRAADRPLGPLGQLDATRRIGAHALSKLVAGRDLAGLVRYGSGPAAELYALSEDPAEVAARLADFRPDALRATTRPDLALAVAAAAFRDMPARYPGRALLLFVDGRSEAAHLLRAVERARALRAEGVSVHVLAQADPAVDREALLLDLAGRPDRLLVLDLSREREVEIALSTIDAWSARGWAGGAFAAPLPIGDWPARAAPLPR